MDRAGEANPGSKPQFCIVRGTIKELVAFAQNKDLVKHGPDGLTRLVAGEGIKGVSKPIIIMSLTIYLLYHDLTLSKGQSCRAR